MKTKRLFLLLLFSAILSGILNVCSNNIQFYYYVDLLLLRNRLLTFTVKPMPNIRFQLPILYAQVFSKFQG
jgi:hypothetical protein